MKRAWLGLALLGCAGSDPSGAPRDAATSAASPSMLRSASATQAGSPPAAPERPSWAVDGDSTVCADVRRRFSEGLARASGACSTAADCGCYDPVAAGLGCGGVTDAATSKALAAIEAELHANGCRWPLQCAAWACQPRCVAGRCAR